MHLGVPAGRNQDDVGIGLHDRIQLRRLDAPTVAGPTDAACLGHEMPPELRDAFEVIRRPKRADEGHRRKAVETWRHQDDDAQAFPSRSRPGRLSLNLWRFRSSRAVRAHKRADHSAAALLMRGTSARTRSFMSIMPTGAPSCITP